jgi:hypothetical protein
MVRLTVLIAFFLLPICAVFSHLKSCNIPVFNPHALHVMYYTTTKDLSNGALKYSLLSELKRMFEIELFIETGTFHGNTTAIAATVFDEVHSIEIFPEFYFKAKDMLKKAQHVHLHLGDSGTILNQLLPLYPKKTLFYLDGHFDGGISGKGDQNTPIREELAAIRNSGKSDSIILIDDIFDFQESLYSKEITNTCFDGYPTLKELIGDLLKINSEYQFCFLGNALLAFPPTENVSVSPVLSSCAISRLSTVADGLFSEEILQRAEKTIAGATGHERAELINYYNAYALFEWQHGWRSFSSFWYALIVQRDGNYKEAFKIFETAAHHSLPGWRINQYAS